MEGSNSSDGPRTVNSIGKLPKEVINTSRPESVHDVTVEH